jgi:carbamoyltransferase
VKKEWQEKIQACFHREDKTARPQLVRKETNRFFWEIINAFRNLSGIPALLNTSFNGHGEPIVNSPDQALAHLRDGTIDVLITNGLIIRKKYTWDLI